MNPTPLVRTKGRCTAFTLIACSLFWSTIASGQLIWGVGGNGGSGTWDTTTANWWNGSKNVTWTNSSRAIFSGTGGVVTLPIRVAATSITFDAPGYTIQDGYIDVLGSTLTITTNQPATIGALLSDPGVNGTLVKNGAATLTVSRSMVIDQLQVNSGEYRLSGSSDLFSSSVTLADAAGVTVTLGQSIDSAFIKSLSGGGPSGGIVQPNDLPRTVTAKIFDSGTFRGILQDNGSGKLGLEISASADTVTLAGPNTYSGPTLIRFGTLAFSENGTASNSEITIHPGGTLRLDNSATALADRLSDASGLTVQGGLIELVGNSSASVEEQLGVLKFSGAVSVSATQPGSATTLLTFAGAIRENRSTIDFGGNGRTKWQGIANDSAGIVGPYATVGNDWATVGNDGRVDALASYATDINAAAPADHVRITGGGTTSLSASAVRETLNLQNSSSAPGILDLGAGNVLTLGAGGILSSGTEVNRIQGGTLRAGGTELVITTRTALTIDSNVGEAVAGTGLTKSGAGTLTLTGTNSYSGNTVINQGTLLVSSDANLGTGSEIQFNGGTLKAAGSFSSTKSLTNGAPNGGVIDTAGFDVAFSGTNSLLSKTGAGTLTLSNASPGNVLVFQGTLALTNPSSGSVGLLGGTLLASGSISGLRSYTASTLDIGGSIPTVLTTKSLRLESVGPLTVRFDLGPSAQDLWAITETVTVSTPVPRNLLLFDFHSLGNIAPGSDFTLMEFGSSSRPLTSSMFGFAPAAIAAGWRGTFSVVSNEVHVRIATAPEPGSVALLVFGGMALGGGLRARRSPSQSQPR